MRPGFHELWAIDYYEQYPRFAVGEKKFVKFFLHWITMAGYSGRSAEYRSLQAEQKRLHELLEWLKEMHLEPSECLFIPYHHYSSGSQLGESLYHYLAGLIFKDMGFLVCNEYAPSLVTDNFRTPDVSAFKTQEISDMLMLLRKKGIVASGAFLEELQMHAVFGEQKFKPRDESSPQTRPLTEAQSVLIEVKRSETNYNLKKGRDQIRDYLLETYGLYDEGYLMSPISKHIQSTGDISIGKDGQTLFSRAEKSASEFVPYWNERKKKQLDSIKAQVFIELTKNLPLERTLTLCETHGQNSIKSYGFLLEDIRSLNMTDLLNAIV